MARLGDVCIINPKSPGFDDKLEVSFIPMLKVGENGEFDSSETKEYHEVRKGFTYFQNNDVLFAKITPCMENGKGAIAKNLKNGAGFGSTEFHVLRPLTEYLSSEWLFYLLSWPLFRKEAEKNMTGSAGQKRVPKSFLEQYQVTLPGLETQKQMTDILDKVCELIALRKQQLTKLDELVKSRFIELFDGKYETKPLQAVCEELFAGGDVKKDKSSNTQSEEYPYPIYTNGEKDNGLYGYTSIVRVVKEAVTISGRGTIGFTCLRKEPFYPAVRLIVAVPKRELVSGCYLQHFIQSKNYGGQGASIPQLTVPMIKDEPIPVPPMELQEGFAAFVEQTDKSKLAVQQALDKLETLKKALMQEYFG